MLHLIYIFVVNLFSIHLVSIVASLSFETIFQFICFTPNQRPPAVATSKITIILIILLFNIHALSFLSISVFVTNDITKHSLTMTYPVNPLVILISSSNWLTLTSWSRVPFLLVVIHIGKSHLCLNFINIHFLFLSFPITSKLFSLNSWTVKWKFKFKKKKP